MAVALTVASSRVLESAPSCPWLCVDALPCSTVAGPIKGGGETRLCRKKQLRTAVAAASPLLQIGSSFVHRPLNRRFIRKQIKIKSPSRFVIVSEIAGQYEDSFDDVKTQTVNYFTYKAVRTVMHQLYEMNPPHYTWFYNFVVSNKPGDGKRFLKVLVKENQELAERVMTTRLHLYGKWIKKCNHAEIYKEISEENLELMRERLMETVIWPSEDTNTDMIA